MSIQQQGSSNLLLVGSGGREHALLWKLQQSPRLRKIVVLPGNAGSLIQARLGSEVGLQCAIEQVKGDINDNEFIVNLCKEKGINLVFVGPEAPLANGLADELQKVGIHCFGPSKSAAEIEASKAFSKQFMVKYNIPTARYHTFSSSSEALKHINEVDYPIVIKASGLAAGKGVIIPTTKEESIDAIRSLMEEQIFGTAGTTVVIEEYLTGAEASILAFTDGHSVVPLPPAQDHKRIFDGDHGGNTGGMGAFAPSPGVSKEVYQEVVERIVKPAIAGMEAEGRPFVGVIYAGVMLTEKGPMCLEYNCRFGDPETQVLLPLLKSDLYEVIEACCSGKLSEMNVQFYEDKYASTVVLASAGYPNAYAKGDVIHGLDDPYLKQLLVFHAGTTLTDQGIVTSGGRVLAVTATGSSLQGAISQCYQGIQRISFKGMQYRKDIGAMKLKKVRIAVLGSTRGTDMQAIINSIQKREINAEIAIVISNIEDAYILERARLNHIPANFIPFKGRKRSEFDGDVLKLIRSIGDVDLVLLIGFMKIVSETLLVPYEGRILNVHPSLLPEFAGGMDLDVHEKVLKAGRQKSGCTVHFVTKEVDKGGIIIQKECPVSPTETVESLKQKVQLLEGEALIEAIRMYQQGRLH